MKDFCSFIYEDLIRWHKVILKVQTKVGPNTGKSLDPVITPGSIPLIRVDFIFHQMKELYLFPIKPQPWEVLSILRKYRFPRIHISLYVY